MGRGSPLFSMESDPVSFGLSGDRLAGRAPVVSRVVRSVPQLAGWVGFATEPVSAVAAEAWAAILMASRAATPAAPPAALQPRQNGGRPATLTVSAVHGQKEVYSDKGQ